MAEENRLVNLVLVLTTCRHYMHCTYLSPHKHMVADQRAHVKHTRVYIIDLQWGTSRCSRGKSELRSVVSSD